MKKMVIKIMQIVALAGTTLVGGASAMQQQQLSKVFCEGSDESVTRRNILQNGTMFALQGLYGSLNGAVITQQAMTNCRIFEAYKNFLQDAVIGGLLQRYQQQKVNFFVGPKQNQQLIAGSIQIAILYNGVQNVVDSIVTYGQARQVLAPFFRDRGNCDWFMAQLHVNTPAQFLTNAADQSTFRNILQKTATALQRAFSDDLGAQPLPFIARLNAAGDADGVRDLNRGLIARLFKTRISKGAMLAALSCVSGYGFKVVNDYACAANYDGCHQRTAWQAATFYSMLAGILFGTLHCCCNRK